MDVYRRHSPPLKLRVIPLGALHRVPLPAAPQPQAVVAIGRGEIVAAQPVRLAASRSRHQRLGRSVDAAGRLQAAVELQLAHAVLQEGDVVQVVAVQLRFGQVAEAREVGLLWPANRFGVKEGEKDVFRL